MTKNAKKPVFSAVFALPNATKKRAAKSVNSKIVIFQPLLALVCIEFITDLAPIRYKMLARGFLRTEARSQLAFREKNC